MHWFATDKRTALVDEPMQTPAPPLVKSDPHEGFRRYPYCCGGVLDDFRRRARHCGDDYATAVRHWSKTLSSALFMFFATVFSTVALGVVIQKNSSNRIGLAEYLFMNSLAGMAHAVLGGQPLLVLRPTGPITLIVTILSNVADSLDFDFFALLAATGLFVSLLMVAAAAVELPRLIRRLTPFTHDIFACFVCSIYVKDGFSQSISFFDEFAFGTALWCTNLALATLCVSAFFHVAGGWAVLPPRLRLLVADYAVTLAVVLVTALSYAAAGVRDILPRIVLDPTFGPTCHLNASAAEVGATPACVDYHGAGAGSERPWAVDLAAAPPAMWGYALLFAVPISFFFFMDQNISSLLCQLDECHLQRGRYFHSSFLLMGVFEAIGPCFGLPFVTGSLPHSPQFVAALTTRKPGADPHVAESRVAPLLMYALIGLPLLTPSVLELIPNAAIYGVLAFVGLEGIVQTALWKRLWLMITPPSEFPPQLRSLRPARVHLYTLIQLLAFAGCWVMNLFPNVLGGAIGLFVSLLIVSLVPLRELVIPRVFSEAELDALDGDGREIDDDALAAAVAGGV